MKQGTSKHRKKGDVRKSEQGTKKAGE